MTVPDDSYRATVAELFDNFRGALLAVLPIADRAMINYRDEQMHRDWERLAESLFDAFVRSPIGADRVAVGRELPLARYDIDLDDYLTVSWLAVDAGSPYRGVVVRSMSHREPFDRVQVVDVDPVTLQAGGRRTVAVSQVLPVLCRRLESGEVVLVDRIEAVE